MANVFVYISYILAVVTFPFSMFWCLRIAQEYERIVVFRLGRLIKTGVKGPGIFFILPCLDNFITVDLRTVSCDVPTQEILTKDSVTISVDAVVFFRICNPIESITNVEDVRYSTQLLAQTTLRNILGTKTLAEVLSDREQIKQYLEDNLGPATRDWGVIVERVEVKDVRLPINLQRVMAAEAEAVRSARAKMIRAEGEHQASVALRHAADIVATSPHAVQLRYLQTLSKISGERAETVVLPLPVEFIKRMLPDYVKRNLGLMPKLPMP